jgi:hypothetical protein
MSTSSTRAKTTITARINPKMLEQLRLIAQAEDRSVGGELRRAVAEHVARKTRSPLASDDQEAV